MSTPIRIDVSSLLGGEGERKHFNALVKMEPLHRRDEEIQFQTYVEVDVAIESTKRGILVVEGDASGMLGVVCSRCLGEFSHSARVPLEETFCVPMRQSECEECYIIEGQEIDLGPAIDQAFLLALPMKMLCHEECAGLCSVCGANLNETKCDHGSQETRGSAFGVLEQFLGGEWETGEKDDED